MKAKISTVTGEDYPSVEECMRVLSDSLQLETSILTTYIEEKRHIASGLLTIQLMVAAAAVICQG